MDASNTTEAPPTLPERRTRVAGGVGTQPLTERQEKFARALAQGVSYAEAWRVCGFTASSPGGRSKMIHDLAYHPGVKARVVELRKLADAEPIASIAERIAWLRLIVSADPAELSRVEYVPCDLCWPDARIAEMYARHFEPGPFDEERPALCDTKLPRIGCERCEGHGVKMSVVTPTELLSPAGRALFNGTKLDKQGNIIVLMKDQLAASDQLNKLQSAYVTKSLNINANMNVPPAKDASPVDALRLFDAFT